MKKQIWILATAMLALSGCDGGVTNGENEAPQSVDRIAESGEVSNNTTPSENDAKNDAEKLKQLVAASQCLGVAKAKAEYWSKNYDAASPDNFEVADTMVRAISAYLLNTSKPVKFKQSESNTQIDEYQEKIKNAIRNYSPSNYEENQNIENIQKDCDKLFDIIVGLPETYGELG